MTLVKRAIWVIERNLDQDLSLGDIAGACSVSTFHLSHAFAERTGKPITEYVRSRRLSLAAEKLAAGYGDILDLALASGYGSHEAFSRAFKARFGLSPDDVRTRKSVDGLPLALALDMTTAEAPALPAPEFRDMPTLTFACLSGRFSLANMQGIPALWQQFMTMRPLINEIADLGAIGMMGAVDEDGSFDYAPAVKVARASDVPKHLSAVQVAAHRYAAFKHEGHVSAIRGTYAQIWSNALVENGWTMADQPSLEVHPSTFNPGTGEGGVEIRVPIVAAASTLS